MQAMAKLILFQKLIITAHLLNLISFICATSVQMRVVKDTASYGYFGNNGENENNRVTSTAVPSNFSGPLLLQRLVGRCYNFTQDQYRYTFCPFQNFSQSELTSRWNAYHGILGIWSHWDIKNNSFSSMIYNRGDKCGDIERSVQVQLECGSTDALVNVTEPSRCRYSALFHTRYICHNDSLLVYPRLTADLRERWDQLLTDFKNGDITEKGYLASLEKLFQTAGFSESTSPVPPEEVISEVSNSPNQMRSIFTDLATCNKEYQNIVREVTRLNQEIDSLRLLLDLSKLENRTTKPHQGNR